MTITVTITIAIIVARAFFYSPGRESAVSLPFGTGSPGEAPLREDGTRRRPEAAKKGRWPQFVAIRLFMFLFVYVGYLWLKEDSLLRV